MTNSEKHSINIASYILQAFQREFYPPLDKRYKLALGCWNKFCMFDREIYDVVIGTLMRKTVVMFENVNTLTLEQTKALKYGFSRFTFYHSFRFDDRAHVEDIISDILWDTDPELHVRWTRMREFIKRI